jgi:hypothetical protein
MAKPRHPELDALRERARAYWRGERTAEAREAHTAYEKLRAEVSDRGKLDRPAAGLDEDATWTAAQIRAARCTA